MFVLSIFLAANKSSYSQNNEGLVPRINIPTSPEAALLGRFGDIPIGYYTGTASIAIPLYSLSVNGIEIPITLSYHSSGIKVEDQATWVGLGWDLSPEGSIVQEVRGKSDEEDFGNYCTSNPSYDIFLHRFDIFLGTYGYLPQMGRQTSTGICDFPEIYPLYNYDNTEGDPYCAIDKLQRGFLVPDIYNYNFGGFSGKFYINPETHQPVLIDKQEQIFFEKTSNDNIKATTLDGTIYNFGAVEKANSGIGVEYTGKTYKVNNITLLNGKTITFHTVITIMLKAF